jgi:hypothetical protein
MTFSIPDAQTGAGAEPSAPLGTSAVARWHWVQTKVLDHPDLTTAEICVAIVLASHVNDRTQNCFPKIETIAREASLSDRKVRQALKRLSELGLVAKRSRAVGRLRNRNAYHLVDLGSKPALGSLIAAQGAAVKPARGAGSNKKNTDKEENQIAIRGRCENSAVPAPMMAIRSISLCMACLHRSARCRFG